MFFRGSHYPFRMALASCFEYKSYKRQVGKDLKYFLSSDDELLLTSFIKSNFTLCIKQKPSPWEEEDIKIKLHTPPLNIQHNKKGWNLENIKLLRKLFRDRAISIKSVSSTLAEDLQTND